MKKGLQVTASTITLPPLIPPTEVLLLTHPCVFSDFPIPLHPNFLPLLTPLCEILSFPYFLSQYSSLTTETTVNNWLESGFLIQWGWGQKRDNNWGEDGLCNVLNELRCCSGKAGPRRISETWAIFLYSQISPGMLSLKMLTPEDKPCAPKRGVRTDTLQEPRSHHALQLSRRSQILESDCQVALFSNHSLNPQPALTRALRRWDILFPRISLWCF